METIKINKLLTDESEKVVELTKQLCNQLVDFENVVVEYRKELSK